MQIEAVSNVHGYTLRYVNQIQIAILEAERPYKGEKTKINCGDKVR